MSDRRRCDQRLDASRPDRLSTLALSSDGSRLHCACARLVPLYRLIPMLRDHRTRTLPADAQKSSVQSARRSTWRTRRVLRTAARVTVRHLAASREPTSFGVNSKERRTHVERCNVIRWRGRKRPILYPIPGVPTEVKRFISPSWSAHDRSAIASSVRHDKGVPFHRMLGLVEHA